ncbi:MAG: TolB-like 6-bladed beta-propeller domain-containing protein [Ignavibacterium sp.]|jgi:hypothetical protein|nr:TolB-like 6-bladed beta-propeller domain-containing protein [Ignavibacterium sp.]
MDNFRNKTALWTWLIILLTVSCSDNKTEISDKHRDRIVSVEDKIIDIKPEIIFGNSLLYIIDNVLIVQEMEPERQKSIHLFDKNTFSYITSTGFIGRGPGEVASMGRIGIDRKNRILWVQDHGNKVMWKFPMDSILHNQNFKPTIKLDLKYDSFIERFGFINDSIVIGKAVQIKDGAWIMSMAKLNINNNVIEKYGYEHPEAIGKKSNSLFALSLKNDFYVNCYYECDLITICDLAGNLKYNIYGPDGLENKDFKKSYFFAVDVADKYIFAAYIGETGIVYEGSEPRGNSPSKFLIYDMEGNYIKTIETGSKFSAFCLDEENNRIILYFNDRTEALAYIHFNFDSLKMESPKRINN